MKEGKCRECGFEGLICNDGYCEKCIADYEDGVCISCKKCIYPFKWVRGIERAV